MFLILPHGSAQSQHQVGSSDRDKPLILDYPPALQQMKGQTVIGADLQQALGRPFSELSLTEQSSLSEPNQGSDNTSLEARSQLRTHDSRIAGDDPVGRTFG